MSLAPPGIARRWTVIGHTLDHWECTTIIDLPAGEDDRILIHPAAVTTYSVAISRKSARMLMHTMESGDACTVPAEHPTHGSRLLGLRPITLPNEIPWTERPADAPPYLGPMELYLRLPDAQIAIIFRHERLLRLATILAEILHLEHPVAQ